MALFTEIADQRGIAWSLRGLGFTELTVNNLVQAQLYVERSLALCRDTQDVWGIAWTLFDLGYVALARDELRDAQSLLEEALPLLEQQGILFGAFRALMALGHVMRGLGQVATRATHPRGAAVWGSTRPPR